MGRPHKERKVEQLPSVTHYKPAGVPLRETEEIVLTIEEMEAIRLADIEQLTHAAAAEKMDVSPPTFHRIVNKAHAKIAAALWQGKALRIEGGNYRIAHSHQSGLRHFRCQSCDHNWSVPYGTGLRGRDMQCPNCESRIVKRES